MPYSRLWLGLFGLLVAVQCVHGFVVGIDLGSQWYKMALRRPNRPIDIVLNEQSSRKTHTMVGWNKDERAFGSDSFNLVITIT
jgi:hypoxia up-regulated 1